MDLRNGFLKSILMCKSDIFYFLIFIGVQLIYNAVLISGVQQCKSYIYIYIHIYTHTYTHTHTHTHTPSIFKVIFPYNPLQSIE